MMKPDLSPRTLIQTQPASCVRHGGKRSVFHSLAFTASLACLLPFSLFAKDKDQDQDKHNKKEGKGNSQNHGNGSPNQPQPAIQGVRPVAVQSGKNRSQAPNPGFAPQGQASARRASQPAAQQAFRSGNPGSIAQQIPNPVQFAQPQGTRENRYGGQWYPSSTHSDWDRGGDHYWGSRHYRWYDGGWLIISTGNNQGYERGYERGYVSQHSVARNVQRKLANQGYYNGPIDGDIGPGSRRAIMDYQDNNGLRATGWIDDRLLVSLGLE